MERSEFKELGKLLMGVVTNKPDGEMTDEEFDKLVPDWDEVVDDVARELQKRTPPAKVNDCEACGGLFDDDDAVLLHRMICGCPCPENSEGRDNLPNNGTMMAFPTFEQYPKTLAKMRKHGFLVNQANVADEKKRTEEYLDAQRE
jgi:hypothetical protein